MIRDESVGQPWELDANNMAYHYSAYRPLTPITPIHTPHASSGSVRVRTPGQLSLHEYRKQQATPSPPAVSGQKTIKRKTGVSFLNQKENQSTVAPPSLVRLSSPSPPDSPGEVMPARSASPPIKTTLFPEFIHLVSSSPPTAPIFPPTSTLSHKQLAQDFQPGWHDSPPVLGRESENENEGNAHRHDTNQRVHQYQFQSLGGNFKPIKRLPRPPAPDWRYSTPPPIHLSSSSNSPIPSSEGLTSSSTLSLSKFHFPNHPSPTRSAPPSVPTSTVEPHPVSVATTPTTPTVLHYRGASFDLINPHESLRLSRIQTPPERDYDQSNFTVIPSLEDLIAEEMAHSERGTAPHRPLFDNFSTAFASITKSNSGLKVSADASASTDTLLPTPTPQVPTSSQHHANDGASTAESPRTDTNTPTQESPLRRIARRFPSIRSFKRKDTLVDEAQVTSASSPPAATEPSRIGSQAFECNIQPTVPDNWWEELPKLGLAMLEDGQGGPLHGSPNPSNATFEPSHRLGSGSYYADSATGGYRPSSTVVDNRQTIAFGHKTGLLDYSDETINPSSHPYDFAETSHNDPHTSHSQLAGDVASNRQTDTLLSGIIRSYQNEQETSPSTPAALQPEGDLSQQPLVTEGIMEGDSLAIMSSHGHEDDKKREGLTFGLSQFDFGLDRNSPLGEANLATGQGWSSPESNPTPLQIAPGPPPTAPLPPAPDSRFVEPPYMQNFPTRCQSDVGSSCVSYGDTRNLLNPEGSEYLSILSPDAMRGVIGGRVEDATAQAIALLSSQSELPYNLEIADASTTAVQHDAYDIKPVDGEPFSSELSMPEIGRALTNVNVNQGSEVSDVTELSTDIYHDGAYYIDDHSLQVAPLNVTPKENDDAEVSPVDQPQRDADDQDEWETVIEESRQNLVDRSGNSITGDTSRFPRNVRDFSATIHPAHSTFNVSRYRLCSPAGSGEPFMVPEYQYGPNSAFTHRNALTPPVPAMVPGSSSAPMSASQRPKTQRMPLRIDTLHHAASTGSPSLSGRHQQNSPYVDPKLLSPDPNDDIVYEGAPFLLSQPASPHGNSFNKFTQFGPNVSLTGSFLGTGIRDAGSSLADSSSPVHPNGSPRGQYKPSPLAQVVGLEEPSTPTGTAPLTPQSEEYNKKAQDMQTTESRHTAVLKHKPRFLPIAPPQAHVRTSLSRDEYFGLQRASRPDNVPRPAVTKPPHAAISGVRPPPPSHPQLQIGSPNSTSYNPFRKPPVPAIPDHEEDLIELDSLPSRSSFSRPFRLASRANNTLSKDTLHTQFTGYSMLVPSRYESSAHTITPLRAKRTRSYTPSSRHHRRQFSGSALAQLRLSHSEVVLRRHNQAMEEFSERIRKKEVFWSNFILWALCWTAAIPLVVWGTNKLDPLMVWLTGVNGATFTEQSKRKSLIVGVFFGILYCTAVAVLIPLGLTGVVQWS